MYVCVSVSVCVLNFESAELPVATRKERRVTFYRLPRPTASFPNKVLPELKTKISIPFVILKTRDPLLEVPLLVNEDVIACGLVSFTFFIAAKTKLHLFSTSPRELP